VLNWLATVFNWTHVTYFYFLSYNIVFLFRHNVSVKSCSPYCHTTPDVMQITRHAISPSLCFVTKKSTRQVSRDLQDSKRINCLFFDWNNYRPTQRSLFLDNADQEFSDLQNLKICQVYFSKDTVEVKKSRRVTFYSASALIAMQSAVLAMGILILSVCLSVRPSIRPSVRPSVRLSRFSIVSRVQTNEDTILRF